MKITEDIYKLHQYCLDNNLSIVYYNSFGHHRSAESYIKFVLSREVDSYWNRIVIEEFDMTIRLYEFCMPGWEEIKNRLDYLVLTRTFS